MSDFLLVAVAALLAFASSQSFVDYLNQKTNCGGVNFVEVHCYFIRIGLALPEKEMFDVKYIIALHKVGKCENCECCKNTHRRTVGWRA